MVGLSEAVSPSVGFEEHLILQATSRGSDTPSQRMQTVPSSLAVEKQVEMLNHQAELLDQAWVTPLSFPDLITSLHS